jgi:3-oxoacyl-[acyl-carrier-protein] synthase-1
MSRAVAITAYTARTPVGLRADAAGAAVIAGISRLRFHPVFVTPSGDHVKAAIDARLDPELQGVPRMVALAVDALSQMWGALPKEIQEGPTRIPVLLSVPEHRPGFTPADEATLLAELHRGASPALSIQVGQRGHAGALHSLGVAAQWISAGQAELVLVGGVESYFSADTIEWMIEHDQIASEGSRSPFVPGEGACFLALMSTGMSAQTRLPVLSGVRGVGNAHEAATIKSEAINQGKALTNAVNQAAANLRLPEEAATDVWCDLNGERYRTDEWSYVLLRSPHVFHQEHGKAVGYEMAADSWGDMGAASGALLVMLTLHEWRHGFAKGKRALVFCGSEGGLRTAVMLEHTDAIERKAAGWLQYR